MNSLADIFSDMFSISPVHANHGTEPPSYKFPTVHPLDSEPVNIIQPNNIQGPWIAGGACLRWIQNQPVGDSDLDVFCSCKEQAQKVIEQVKSYGRYSNKFTSDNATTLDYYSHNNTMQWTIQIITKRYYTDPQEIINNFDVSVCQIATDGERFLLGKDTAKDIRERNLRMRMPLQPDAVKRLTKYWTYGYRPVEGLIEAVQNNPDARWEYQVDEDYR